MILFRTMTLDNISYTPMAILPGLLTYYSPFGCTDHHLRVFLQSPSTVGRYLSNVTLEMLVLHDGGSMYLLSLVGEQRKE